MDVVIVLLIMGLLVGSVILACLGIHDLKNGAPLTAAVTLIMALTIAIFATYPLWGNMMICEYIPAEQTGYYTEQCTNWEL